MVSKDILYQMYSKRSHYLAALLLHHGQPDSDQYNTRTDQLLHDIFEKSRVPNSELFDLDADLVIQLLSSFEGQQVYPETVSKKETFSEALEQRNDKLDRLLIPNGEYYLAQTVRGFGEVSAVMRVEEGVFTVLKGCACAPTKAEHVPEVRQNAPIENNTLLWDVSVDSPSAAGWIVLGYQNNGWMVWKNKDGHPIDIYRKK